jgi:hypothetical protein
MKLKLLVLIGLCTLFFSCGSASYFGERLAPTTSVDVYYSEHDVKKPFKVMGHLKYVNYFSADQDVVKGKLIKNARELGGDAIVILGTTTVEDAVDAIVNAEVLKYN